MLQTFRDNLKGTMAIFIVGLMIIPFALFGIDSLFLQDNSAGKAAEVNGEAISEVELTRAVRIQKQQLLERFGEQVPADMISDEQLRPPVLTRLMNRELLKQAATDGGMAVGDAEINQLITATPQFQQNGKFSAELYTQLLRNMGYTPAGYKKLLIEDVLVNQHASGVNASAFATDGDIKALTAITQQTRSFYFLTLPYESAVQTVSVSDEDVQAYYDANQAQFMRPEQVSVEYIELSLDSLAEQKDVDPEAVKAQYQQEVANFEASIQRHAAHILIENGEGSEEKIKAVEARLHAGDDFAAIAKDLSDDAGSSSNGGDVGTTDGSSFPQSFETALADLSVGEVSSAVETDAGTHFIKLLDTEEAKAPSFEEARTGIEEHLARASAESTFVEILEELPDATYNAASLKDAAESLGLEAKTSKLFDRRGGPGILSNNQVLAEVFSDDVLHEGLASHVIEVSDNHVVVVKLKEHKDAAVKPLDDIHAQVKDIVTKDKVAVVLNDQAEALLTKLGQGEQLESVATDAGLEWQVKADTSRNDQTLDRQLLEHIFNLPKPQSNKAVNTSVTLQNGDQVVAQLTVAKPGSLPDMDEAQMLVLKQRLSQELSGEEFAAYQSALNDTAEIKVY